MMDKYQEVICRYEKARQLVRELNSKRSALLGECESLGSVIDQYGFETQTGKVCLNSVFDELLSMIEENHGEYYTYEEVLDEMQAENKCCDFCYESYKVKARSLADAKKEFGNAKRQISNIGKSLLKSCNST